MAPKCRILVAAILCLQCGTLANTNVCAEAGNQCDISPLEGSDDVTGHALIATRVVRHKVDGIQVPPPVASEAVLSSPLRTHAQQVAAVEELRALVARQGTVTKEQLHQLLDMTTAALAQQVDSAGMQPSALLDANATQPAGVKSTGDALRDQREFEKGFLQNGDDDESLVFPKRKKNEKKEEQEKPVDTLTYDEKEPVNMKHVLSTYVVVPLAFVFLVIFTLSNIMEKFEITFIPESGIIIVIGFMLGTFMKIYGHFDFFEDPDKFAEFNSAILNLILLPIIIFASGWALRRQDFLSQLPYILLFAMGGVALSTVVIACLIHLTGSMELHSVGMWRTAFAYASLISATDPVATLSTYAKLKVDPLLNIMVFGESIINDAVAVVLFGVFNSDHYMVSSNGHDLEGLYLLGSIVWGVLKIFFSSALLGVFLGIGYTLIAHWADMRHNKKGQILVILCTCYLTYALAESCHMSGIIAEMFAALIMGVYMRPHLSSEGSLLATFFVKQLATLADAAVCLLIGVAVVQLTTKGWYFGLWTMLFCLVGRCASVFPVGLLVNMIKQMVGKANRVPEDGWNTLSSQHMFMMWHAGLRGAIAMALALELGPWVDEIDGSGTRRALQSATFLILGVFLLIFGGSTAACLNYLGIPTGCDLALDHLSKTEDMGPVRGCLKAMDKKILSPLLVGKEKFHEQAEEEKDVEDLLKDVKRYGNY
jgi:sodium/hydrogen exchanger 8